MIVESIRAEYRRYKLLAERAMAQVGEADLSALMGEDVNSIALVVRHLAGNLRSRFTDFLTSDGEKPWRNRDEEFVERVVDRGELEAIWQGGWAVLEGALAELEDGDLERTVTIRRQPLSVAQALLRSLAHVAYHVGQIVLLARLAVGGRWQSLSIPRGGSTAYNQNPTREKPPAG